MPMKKNTQKRRKNRVYKTLNPTPLDPSRQAASSINLLYQEHNSFKDQDYHHLQEAFNKLHQETSWLNIVGIHHPKIIEQLVDHFNLHELSCEAILNTSQRPKFDDYGNYIHITSKIFFIEQDQLEEEQITILFNDKILITILEKEKDIFAPLRSSLLQGSNIAFKKKTDFIAYSLLDIIIDQYYVVIEHFEEHIDILEQKVLDYPEEHLLTELNEVKQEMAYLRRTIAPLRETFNKFEKSDTVFIHPETLPFIRDLRDYSIQVTETINIYKDSLNSLTDLYMSSLSNKMNNIMKVLTIVSTIFIPLTFIVGVYGMNFVNMPELTSPYGYYITLLGMGILTLIMIIFFKYKKWL